MHPSVSVIVPAYNNACFIAEAIQSIIAQTCPVGEIIVVDDGSTDETPRLVDCFRGKVRHLRQQNSGPSAARNAGIAAASGEWIAFLDADDRWLPQRIERQLCLQRRIGGPALIFSDQAEIDSTGRIRVESFFANRGVLEFFRRLDGAPIPNALARIVQRNFVPTGTVLVPRAVLDEVRAFDNAIRYGEDLDLWSRIAARYPVVCLPEVVLLHRYHDGNITRNELPMLRDLTRVMEKLRRWAAPQLRSQGADPDRFVAQAWDALGYWHFARGEYLESRRAYMRSLAHKPSWRAATYALASALPGPVTRGMRRIKQKIAGAG